MISCVDQRSRGWCIRPSSPEGLECRLNVLLARDPAALRFVQRLQLVRGRAMLAAMADFDLLEHVGELRLIRFRPPFDAFQQLFQPCVHGRMFITSRERRRPYSATPRSSFGTSPVTPA